MNPTLTKILISPSKSATAHLGALLITCLQDLPLKNNLCIFFKGPIGAGKTTFIRGLLQQLQPNCTVKSPTYTLVESYPIADKALIIHHFDLYRITHPEAVNNLGIRDYFDRKADALQTLQLIEWPEKALGYLPEPELTLDIHYQNPTDLKGRQIVLQYQKSYSSLAKEMIKHYEADLKGRLQTDETGNKEQT